ncbi:synthetase [Cyanidiococcus yangmingshanensis]|uniref:acetate--CoA ligase n=1 Tax=Cyanidiococcus yangmingshanensis TaxID=2690220 RepID=A0A7J7IHD0_9RHOD|nr:synthetase [Cyanidiococcus yangmingshanensis]
MQAGRDLDLGTAMENAAHRSEDSIEWMRAEDPLFLLYTSGSTGTPKGVLHTTGGYMVNVGLSFKYSFNYHPNDVYFCTADCGWITGHSYVVYGPLLNAATQVLFEGIPTWPDAGRLWSIVDKYKVSHLYTAPTVIRSLKKAGDRYVTRYKRSSLKILATVGEPINPQVWEWYHRVVGNGRCNVVDTYWQTETGAHVVISPPVRGFPQRPGSAGVPFFGIKPAVLDEHGKEIPFVPGQESEGYLCIRAPWPSCLRTIFGAQARFENGYFKPFPGYYMTGDGCRRDADGYIWITGRVDDVINVSGHRIGTAEVESALVRHPGVAEAAVVGMPHEIKGECIACFVILADGYSPSETLRTELVQMCRKEIGAFAAPERVIWTPALPKTRSGKIMRRILRKISEQGKELDRGTLGDLSTLADPGAVEAVIQSFLA